jgi:hypothetical protein
MNELQQALNLVDKIDMDTAGKHRFELALLRGLLLDVMVRYFLEDSDVPLLAPSSVDDELVGDLPNEPFPAA